MMPRCAVCSLSNNVLLKWPSHLPCSSTPLGINIPLISSVWGLQEFYCPKIVKRRERSRLKKGKKSKDCSKLKKGRRRCFLAEEEKMCKEKENIMEIVL